MLYQWLFKIVIISVIMNDLLISVNNTFKVMSYINVESKYKLFYNIYKVTFKNCNYFILLLYKFNVKIKFEK